MWLMSPLSKSASHSSGAWFVLAERAKHYDKNAKRMGEHSAEHSVEVWSPLSIVCGKADGSRRRNWRVKCGAEQQEGDRGQGEADGVREDVRQCYHVAEEDSVSMSADDAGDEFFMLQLKEVPSSVWRRTVDAARNVEQGYMPVDDLS